MPYGRPVLPLDNCSASALSSVSVSSAKALQPQTAANSGQSMMKIFTIRLPTGFIAVGVGENRDTMHG